MSNHTPGPWLVSEYGDYGDYDGECRVVLGEGGDIRTAIVLGFDTPENRANANLIAAAPDLLEALKSFLRAPSTGSDGPGSITIVVQDFNLKAARAAIAKAEGGAA